MAEVAYASASRVFAGSPPVRAVDGLDLEVSDGEFLVLVGPVRLRQVHSAADARRP